MNSLEKLYKLGELIEQGKYDEAHKYMCDIKHSLKVLDIIINKKVDCSYIYYLSVIGGDVNDYNKKLTTGDLNCLTQEEFDSVKEELK